MRQGDNCARLCFREHHLTTIMKNLPHEEEELRAMIQEAGRNIYNW